jgi:hypothetical protein
MKPRQALFVAAFISASFASTAQAQGLVECPVPEIEARVTTKLPSDWWSTPQVGQVTGTEVAKVGGDLTLICKYRAYGTEISVMRKAPSNMGCIAQPTGFACSRSTPQRASSSKATAVTGGFSANPPGSTIQNDSVKVQGGVSTGSPGTAKVMTKTPDAGSASTGKGPSVKYGGSCTDPMLDGVEVRYVTKDPATNLYAFRLVGVVKNAGQVAYTSGSGQQALELHRMAQSGSTNRLQRWDFGNIDAGGALPEFTYDVIKWSVGDEFAPAYRFSITYGPDIRADGNNANDDCRMSNNATTITGAEINAIIRASGI